jgi:hypothetical protein
MRRHARSKWPARLAALAALVGALVGWRLVRGDVATWEAGGYTAGPEMGFVVFLAVAGAAAAFFGARRFLDGPSLSSCEWSLSFIGPVDATIGRLADALRQRGYALEILELDDAAEPVRAAPPLRALGGAQLALVDERARRGRARVVLRLSAPAVGAGGIGLVESEDTAAGFYDELAQYLIAALAELVPGIGYQRGGSSLQPAPAESLRELLPPEPSRLVKGGSR